MALSPGPNQINDIYTTAAKPAPKTERFAGLHVGDEFYLDIDQYPVRVTGFHIDGDGETRVRYENVYDPYGLQPAQIEPEQYMGASHIMDNLAAGNFMRKFRNV